VSRVAFANLLVRRRRTALTALAVVLGVSMISGTFVFTDTIHSAFRQLFTGAASGADVIVSSRQGTSLASSAPESIPGPLVNRIAHLPGVLAAQGQIVDLATIIGHDGKPIRQLGAQTLGLSYVPPPFGGLTFESGSPPARSTQVVVDAATASREHYRVGDVVPIVTAGPVQRFEISGIARFTGASDGGEPFAMFDRATARQLYDKQGVDDRIYLAVRKGTTPAALIREIDPLLPAQLVARSAQAEVGTDVARADSQLSILTGGLEAFGLISLLVGAFMIFNAFSVTIAQRIREFALLRSLGATRAQVLKTVVVEAVAIGGVASVAGVFGGLLVALGIRALFVAIGFDLPSGGPSLALRTVALAIGAGVLATLAAGVIPAVRATRATPLEALRASAVTRSPGGWRRWVALAPAAVLALAGVLLVFLTDGSTSARLTAAAAGSVMLVLAIVTLVPAAVRPFSRAVSWPLVRGGRVLAVLARENAVRNPVRTAVGASALMIGLALALFVTVYAAGLRKSTSRIIDRTVSGDFTIQNRDGASPIPAASARAAAAAPGVIAISSLESAGARIGSSGDVSAKGIDPTTISQVYRFDWVKGADSIVANLQPGDVIVERDTARDAHLHVGQATTVTTQTGARASVTVRGIYDDRIVLGGFALAQSAFNPLFQQPRLQDVFVKLGPGADPAVAATALNQALAGFPDVVARSEIQLRNELSSRVDRVLLVFYALLAMSVLMALLGIVNTLSLSVTERTSELGLLRAVGMTAAQARTLVRTESMITAALGTVIGIVVGVLVAWIVAHALTEQGVTFAVPWLQLAVLLVAGLLVGVVAGVIPAARAARVDVLAAIADE
jgi:putative ABC transport system permease protein